jgi:hypothetical protein
MPGYDFSIVTDKGFNAFLHDLAAGAWRDVSIKRYDTLSRMPSTLLIEAPRPVVWKVRATWAITTLKYALGSTSAEMLDELDAEWDAAQRCLSLALSAALDRQDPAQRRAASRLLEAFRAGSGAEQSGYGYDEEVDFGRYQLAITESGPLAEEAERLDLGEHRKRIHETTEALARAIGRTPKQARSSLRSRRVREALAGCATSFSVISEEMTWLLAHTPEGEAKRHLELLRAPFLALLDRYAVHANATAELRRTTDRPTRPYVTHAHL